MYIPKKGLLATYQFLKFGLYQKSGEGRRDWACRILTTSNDNMVVDCGDSWRAREFLISIWNGLFLLAQEEQDQERIDEYSKAKRSLMWAFRNLNLTKPFVIAAYLFAGEKADGWAITKRVDKACGVYIELAEYGIRMLEIYAETGKLASWRDVSIPEQTLDQYMESKGL